jgi:hypothetical protein
MRDGVAHGLGLTPGQIARVKDSIVVYTEAAKTGMAFFEHTVAPLVQLHQPDLLFIDPALSFLGGEANSQKDVGGFLRNMLNPLLKEHQCGCIIVHHTNKPPSGREKPDWQAGDFAYLGSGSAEWANWARAVLALRSIGSHSVFELRAGKRGGRLGWKDEDGQSTFARYIGHSNEPGYIYWREVNPDEIEQKGGRPSEYHEAELLELLPDAGLTSKEWAAIVKDECGISERQFFNLTKALKKSGRILKSKATARWQLVTSKSL